MRLLLILLACYTTVSLASQPTEVTIKDAFIEMHTGPGTGYPVFFVVSRDDKINILKERTGWYLVKEHQGREGWVNESQLSRTLSSDGTAIQLQGPTLDKLSRSRYQGSLMVGNFDGASLLSISGSYALTEHLSSQLTINHALGDFSSVDLATIDITHTFSPSKRFSPYASIGSGVMRINPITIQDQAQAHTQAVSFIGVGGRFYLNSRLIARAEYHYNHVHTSSDKKEEITEWKTGLAFFF